MSTVETLLAALRAADWPRARALAVAALAQPTADRAQLHALLGKLAWNMGDESACRDHLEEATARGVPDPAVWTLLAHLSRDRPDRRRQLLSRAAQHPGAGGRPALELAEDLIAARRGQEALQWYATAADDPALAGLAWSRLAVAAADLGLHDVALEALEQLVAVEPTPAGELLLAPVLRLADRVQAHAALDACIALLERQGARSGPLCGLRALRAVADRRPDDAVTWAEQAVAASPESAELQQVLGEVLLLAGQHARAAEVLGPMALANSLPDATRLAWADRLQRQGLATQALNLVEDVLERVPDHAGAWIAKSRICADLGRDGDAEQAILRAMALDDRVDQQAGQATASVRAILRDLPTLLSATEVGRDWQVARLRMGHNALLVQLTRAEGGECYAKAYLPGRRTQRHVQQTAELEFALASDPALACRVPLPLRHPSRAFAHPCGGGWGVVMSAIPGVSLRQSLAEPRQTMGVAHAAALGQALAGLHAGLSRVAGWHRAPAGLCSAVGPLLGLADDPSGMQQLRLRLGLMDAAEALGDSLQAALEPWLQRLTVLASSLQAGVIHGDFGWHNATWSGAQVVGIVDLDYAAWDIPAADLAQGICRTAADWKRLATHRDPAVRPELARALRAGYRRAGGADPGDEALAVLLVATRAAYGLALAQANLDQGSHAPQSYGPVLDAVQLTVWQLEWLAQHVEQLL